MAEQKEQDEQSGFQRWYQRHGDRLNERRRQKYHSDPQYRKKAIERARRYRREGPKHGRREEYQTVYGRHQRVYRVTDVAQAAGVNQTTIRRWEWDGLIPEPTIDSTVRFYTEHQRKLVARFAQERDQCTERQYARLVQYIHDHWEG